MVNQICISVIVPIYNVERYLEACINSIISQTYKNYEVILVNDGSTDDSRYIANKYVGEWENFILVDQENRGLSGARNTGLKYAKGKYVYFCDSDDILENTLFEKCYRECIDNDLDVVFFDFCKIYEDKNSKDNEIHNFVEKRESLTGKQFFKMEIIKCGLYPTIWRQFYKKKFLEDNKYQFIEGLIYEDLEFTPKILMKAERVKCIDNKLYYWRKRNDSITGSVVSLENIKSLEYIIKKNFELIKQNITGDSDLIYAFKKFINIIGTCVISKIDNNKDDDKKNNMIADIILFFLEEYINIFKDSFIYSDYANIGKYINKFNEICCNKIALDNILNNCPEIKHGSNRVEDSINYLIQKNRTELLSKLPFQKVNFNIGIYGIGKHSYLLIKNYEKYIGDIKANIIYVDTYKGSGKDVFMEKQVINVKDINKYKLDAIIISSNLYEETMYNTLQEILLIRTKIYKFYESNWFPIIDLEEEL